MGEVILGVSAVLAAEGCWHRRSGGSCSTRCRSGAEYGRANQANDRCSGAVRVIFVRVIFELDYSINASVCCNDQLFAATFVFDYMIANGGSAVANCSIPLII